MVTVRPVLSLLKLPLPKPTLKSMRSPTAAVFTKVNGTPAFRPLMLPLSTVVEEFSRTETSVVVLSRPKNRPWTRKVPAVGAVQRNTLFSPPEPGCRRKVFGGSTTAEIMAGAPVLLKVRSGKVVPQGGEVREHGGTPPSSPGKG